MTLAFSEKSKALFRKIGPTTITTYLGLALSLISTPLLAQSLGPSGKGELVATFALTQLLAWVGFWGVPRTLAIEFVKTGNLNKNAFRMLVYLGIGNAILILALAPLFSDSSEQVMALIRLSSVTILASGVAQLGLEIAMVKSDLWIWNASRFGYAVMPSLLITFFALVAKLDLRVAFLSTLAGQAIVVAVGIICLKKYKPPFAGGQFNWREAKNYWVTSTLDSLSGRSDLLLLAALASATILGPYSIAVTVSSATGGLTQAINNAYFAKFVRLDGEAHARALKQASLIGAVSSIVVGLFSFPILLIFGDTLLGTGFHDVAGIALILIFSQALGDQWMLRVFSDSSKANSGGLAISSIGTLFFVAVSVVLLSSFGLLNGYTMALVMVSASIIRLSIRMLLRRKNHD